MSHRRQFGTIKIKKYVPLFVLLLAFFLQTYYLTELRAAFPDSFARQPFCGVDATAHVERASGLLDGSLPGNNTYFFIPFYPFYLAALKRFWGDSLLLPVFMQALLQLVGIAALYGLGRLIFSPLTGALAALGLAIYSYYIFYIPCFDQALLTTPFLTVAVFFMIKFHACPRSRYLLGAGIVFAAAALSRPTILAVLPVVVIWLFWFRESIGQFGRNLIFLVLPLFIAISPITWHNYRVSGRLVILADNFGVNLFTGNNPEAYGLDSLAHIQSQPAVSQFLVTLRRVDKGETTFTAEVLHYIWQQPADALALTARKTWLWFGEREILLVEPFFPWTVAQTRTLAPLPLAWQALVITALLGILLASGEGYSRPRIYLLWMIYATFSLFSILFFVQFRFRLPFVPFVMLSAASLLAMARQWSVQRSRRFWGVLALLLLLLPIVPALGLFALLFGGLGLWPHLGQNRQKVYGRIAVAILFYLFLVAIWARANALASDVSQTINIYLGPPLAATGVLGQTFQMDCDGFNRIDLTLGVFNDRHSQPVTFYLATDISAQEILFSEGFDGSSVRDYQKQSFSFQPIANSAGRSFFFFIASPTSRPDNAITARGYSDTPIDYYPAGSAFAGQLGKLQQLQADFAFGAYCALSPWQKMQAVFSQFRPGFNGT